MIRFTITNIERATFKKSIERDQTVRAEMRVVTLVPVQGKDAADMAGHVPWHGSPDGRIRLAIDDPAFFDQLVLDGEYYIDLTPIGG